MIINGKAYDFETMGLKELFNKLDINSDHIVLEMNGKIIERNDFTNLVVNHQDKLEIVTFVGGG